ncbi:MAG TPA: nuclear transport factor 2 family protein [Longimicrobium sp.]|jgi:hypothetical protein
MSAEDDLEDLVRRLVDAENRASREDAEGILSPSFTAITRSSGQEQDRDGLLEAIGKGSDKVRILEDGVEARVSGDLGVVRSIVTVAGRDRPDVPLASYRNIHVFTREAGDWRCVSWQVTKLE